MKKVLALTMCLLMIFSTIALVACSGDPVNTDATTEASTVETQGTIASTEATTESTTEATTEATTESTTAGPDLPPVVSKDSIKILAIGNSFSDDSMEHLYGILKDCGAKEIILGNMYIGGCALATHSTNIKGDTPSYEFRTNTAGKWSTKTSTRLSYALDYADWDYISLQQVSGLSGVESSYEPYLTDLIAKVQERCPNATLVWNMTWAYQGNSSHSDFGKYGKNQMTMYNAIVSAVNNIVVANHPEIKTVIPCGTTIQNLRTSFIGDTLTRDGYHLNYAFGRYAAAMTWVKAILGWDIDDVTFIPATQSFSRTYLDAIKDAVNKAVANPYEVTESAYTNEASIMDRFNSLNLNINDYNRLDVEMTPSAFYNSIDSSKYNRIISAAAGDTSSNLKKMAASRIFSKSELPNGTIIIAAVGTKFRPEAWKDMEKNTAENRPAESIRPIVVVDDAWWGNFNYRAFNMMYESITGVLTDRQMNDLTTSLAIFVPKNPNTPIPEIKDETEMTPEELFVHNGYDLSKYNKLAIDFTKNAYYNSTSNSNVVSAATGSTASNLTQFAATQIIEKSKLPIGSVIVIRKGYQYRPEGWTALDKKNSSGDRPANTTSTIVVVNSAWWGSFNFRAFNVALEGNPNTTAEQMNGIVEAFAIFVPKEPVPDVPDVPSTGTTIDDFDLSKYVELKIEFTNAAFYNSTDKNRFGRLICADNGDSDSNLTQFCATQIFMKDELPNGTLIVIEDGFQYRPDAWYDMTLNTMGRPTNVTQNVTVVNDAWWGKFNCRAFNVAMKGNPNMTAEQMENIPLAFTIYVPKK